MQNRIKILPNSAALVRARVIKGLTKVELGSVAGIPHSSIVRAEQGYGVGPKTATRLSDALGQPFDALFTIQTPSSGERGEE